VTKPLDMAVLMHEVELLLSSKTAKGKKVLVVDENLVAIGLLMDMLQNQGFLPSTISPQDDLRANAIASRPDIIIASTKLVDQVHALRVENGMEHIRFLLIAE
jgi:PleD family two-component response regulator